MSMRLLWACLGVTVAAFAQAAPSGPTLSCKADAQQTCTRSGCEAQVPVAEAELDLGIRGGNPVFCYGTACWRTVWSRSDMPGRNRITLALSGQASFNGVPDRLLLQASVATDDLRFQASVLNDPGSVQVFSGQCTCVPATSGANGCVPRGGARP